MAKPRKQSQENKGWVNQPCYKHSEQASAACSFFLQALFVALDR
jgi:hypothetical protein